MVKYWDARRIKRVREQRERREQKAFDTAKEALRRGRTIGTDIEKNAELIFDVLALPVRRAMVIRLRKEGAMSLSKLAKPFGFSLPAALKHLHALEGAKFVMTHKHGRVRMCVYDPIAFKELAQWLASHRPSLRM